MTRVALRVNGSPVEAEVEPRLHLADFLREELSLTGTHIGCEHGICGACTVLVDDAPVRSCLMFAVQAEGACNHAPSKGSRRWRGELLAAAGGFLRDHHGLQCGFCTPGTAFASIFQGTTAAARATRRSSMRSRPPRACAGGNSRDSCKN